MELRSGRRLRSSQPLASPGGGGGVDRISALPDDLLLLILAGLRCFATAARTGALSARWRNLWTLLPTLVFRAVKLSSIDAALARVNSPAVVSLLEIHVSKMPTRLPPREREPFVENLCLDGAGVTSLLRAAARLEPKELVFDVPYIVNGDVDLPCFHRTASITLESRAFIHFRVPPAGVEFTALDTLSLSGRVAGLGALIPRCPRLRVLRLKLSDDHDSMTVRSPSLQELFVDSTGGTPRVPVEIVAPVLKKLTMTLLCSEEDATASISAPMMEKVSWQCCHTSGAFGFGFWCIQKLRLQLHTADRQGQLPSLHIHACIYSFYPDQMPNFTPEIDKHMVAVGAFSALELHLQTSGHVYGAFVFHLIGMNQICSGVQRLKVVLQGSTVKEGCPTDCRCDLTNWKTQPISLSALEEMQIDGFEGEGHEFDFLKLVFKSAPMLKRVIVKLSPEVSSSSDGCTKLYPIFKAYSLVECCVYFSSGLIHEN